MIVLFVHGMGRTPLSGWRLLHALRRAGVKTATFGYATTFEDFASIKQRLAARLTALAGTDRYVVIGHSLGGVLLRAAINSLPQTVNRPQHVFLLGSPLQASRLAQKLGKHILFRLLTGDCGQLLASPERMNEIGPLDGPVTSVVGTWGIAPSKRFFGDDPNDGVVSVAEASASWLPRQTRVPVMHTWLPASKLVADVIVHVIHAMRGLV